MGNGGLQLLTPTESRPLQSVLFRRIGFRNACFMFCLTSLYKSNNIDKIKVFWTPLLELFDLPPFWSSWLQKLLSSKVESGHHM